MAAAPPAPTPPRQQSSSAPGADPDVVTMILYGDYKLAQGAGPMRRARYRVLRDYETGNCIPLGNGRFSRVFEAAWIDEDGVNKLTPPTTPTKSLHANHNKKPEDPFNSSEPEHTFAVKVAASPNDRRVMRAEAGILTQLRWKDNDWPKYILGFHGVNIDRGCLLLTRYPTNLEHYIRWVLGALSPTKKEEAIRDLFPCLARELCQGLAWLHAVGEVCVHGDIKPANILLEPRTPRAQPAFPYYCRYADFSAATLLKHNFGGHVGGATWEYMSPEMFANPPPRPSTSADVFSLGMLFLNFIACGRSPYEMASNRYQKFEMAKRGTPISFLLNDPADLTFGRNWHALTPVVKGVVESCVRQQPAERPTAAALGAVGASWSEEPQI
ncbi:kinase-like protein [Aulographum hederae CBS 113979]|uniref:non-specific serine/threonine protein kinase n=1 Tax=Aulographum hederae CBS 113979 TaxID=1176131 RepID=A0A6G1H385_9PEZI|nr:kinase-like protein [Aulographum hederae CBS 113979]